MIRRTGHPQRNQDAKHMRTLIILALAAGLSFPAGGTSAAQSIDSLSLPQQLVTLDTHEIPDANSTSVRRVAYLLRTLSARAKLSEQKVADRAYFVVKTLHTDYGRDVRSQAVLEAAARSESIRDEQSYNTFLALLMITEGQR